MFELNWIFWPILEHFKLVHTRSAIKAKWLKSHICDIDKKRILKDYIIRWKKYNQGRFILWAKGAFAPSPAERGAPWGMRRVIQGGGKKILLWNESKTIWILRLVFSDD